MPDIVRFKDDFPILGAVPIADASSGYEAAAKVAGDASELLGKKAESMAEEKSTFMLMQANNQAEDLKTNTKIEIKKNPDAAASILNSYQQTAASLKSNTMVNKTDRVKLDTLMNNDKNELKLTAANETYRVDKRNASIKIWGSYANGMKSIQEALDSGNMELAKSLSESLVNNFKNGALADAVTPEQYANVLKSVGLVYDRAKSLVDLHNNPNATAQNYHQLYASPFDNDGTNAANLPVNHDTVMLHNDGVNDRSMSGVQNAILNGQQVPWSIAASSDENFAKTRLWWEGKKDASALINSGNDFKIDSRMSDLESKVLKSPREEMEYNALKQHKQRLLYEPQKALSETPMGARIIQDFNDRMNAIKIGGYSDEEKYKLTRDAYNHMVDQNISLSKSLHHDPNETRPIAAEIVAPMAQAFKKGGDAGAALDKLNYLDTYEKQAYAAREMPDPLSRETMQTIALANNVMGVRPEWKKSLIEAQQPMEIKDLALQEGDIKKIKQKLATELSDVNSYLSFGTSKHDPRSQAFLQMAFNKVIYDGIKNGDLTLANSDEYIRDNVYNIRQAYNITSGNTYSANLTQLNIAPSDWAFISRHEQSEVIKNLYGIQSKGAVYSQLDKNPIITILTPTNDVIVADHYGNVLSNHPYSDKLRMKAIHDVSAQDYESIQQMSKADNYKMRLGY